MDGQKVGMVVGDLVGISFKNPIFPLACHGDLWGE